MTVTAGYLALSDNGTSGEDITIRRSAGPGVLVYTEQGISQFLSSNDVAPGAPQLPFLEKLIGTSLGVMALRRKRA